MAEVNRMTLNGQAELNSPVIGATAHRPLRPEKSRCSHIDIEQMTSMRNTLDLRLPRLSWSVAIILQPKSEAVLTINYAVDLAPRVR